MSTYFPYLRGKQSELLALRELAAAIADSPRLLPIIEFVNGNNTTRISIDHYIEHGMPFALIANPGVGSYSDGTTSLYDDLIEPLLSDYENYLPVLQVSRETRMSEVNAFNNASGTLMKGVLYNAEPLDPRVLNWVQTDPRIRHHIFIEGNISRNFMLQFAATTRVTMRDNFKKQIRNADYPPTELFTDLTSPSGNPDGTSWGDYSIQGDYYSESGGPAYAVAIHHVHRSGQNLDISHVLSDRQDTDEDTPGKIIEAVENLVDRLDEWTPCDTSACEEYRHMAQTGISKGLPYLKRLGIRHHLEVMLGM